MSAEVDQVRSDFVLANRCQKDYHPPSISFQTRSLLPQRLLDLSHRSLMVALHSSIADDQHVIVYVMNPSQVLAASSLDC